MRNRERTRSLSLFDSYDKSSVEAELDNYRDKDFLEANVTVSTVFAETAVLQTPRRLRKTLLKYVIYHRGKLVKELVDMGLLKDSERAKSYVRDSLYALRRFVDPED